MPFYGNPYKPIPKEHLTNSKNEKSEVDTAKSSIHTDTDNVTNIEDKYYGETTNQYNNDSKYYNKKNDITSELSNSESSWIIGGLFLVALIYKLKK